MNHRRPSHDELTPEDLFRPEPVQAPQAGGTTIPGEVVRSSEMPWNTPPPQPEYFGEPPAAYQAPQQAPQQDLQPYQGGAAYPVEAYQAPQAPAYGQQQPVEEASTQFMPPFPAAPQQTQAMPPQPSYGGYQQEYGQQQAPQPSYGQPQAYGQPQQGYGQQAPPPQAPGYAAGTGTRGGGPARRFSPKVIAVAVVAACAVVGVVVGIAASGGGKSASAAGAGTPTASASASAQASGSGVDQAQAKALSDLLTTAASSRSSVITAVADIQHCQNLSESAQNLTTAAGARSQLITQLGTLQTSGLPQGAALVTVLKEGWTASRDADTHYAAWAEASKSSCDHKHQPKSGGDKQAGDSASYTATADKTKASRLWDAIAAKTGLPERSKSQL